jgi:hypothetical protein
MLQRPKAMPGLSFFPSETPILPERCASPKKVLSGAVLEPLGRIHQRAASRHSPRGPFYPLRLVYRCPGGNAGCSLNPSSAGGGAAGGGSGLGCVTATPDQASSNPVLRLGGSRAFQFGMKILF